MRFVSLRTKLVLATVVLILIPIVGVGIYTYNEFEKVLTQNIAKAASDRLHQVNKNIERELRAMMNASSAVVLDENVRNVLERPPSTDRETIDNVNLIDKKILEISTAIITDPVYITIIDNYGNHYTNWFQHPDSYERIKRSAFYANAKEQQGYMTWGMNHPNYMNPHGENLVTLAMTIYDNSSTEEIGMLIISEPVSTYLEILRIDNSYLGNMGFIMNKDGIILAEDEQLIREIFPFADKEPEFNSQIFSRVISGEEMQVFTNYIPMTEWLTVQIIPDKSIYSQINQVRDNAIPTLMISLAVFFILIVMLSTMFTRSLKRLQRTMLEVERGNLDVTLNIQSRDEVGLLSKSFHRMLKRLRYHVDNEIILQRGRERAKLEALQAQINPHFLHNTLNTIKWMSIMAGTKNVTEMLMSLGHLLDMSIHRGQELISLQEEMSNVRSFLTIQKYRFGDTIQVQEELDPELSNALVPKLSLQPLVENVYQHGLFIDGGRMTIRSYLRDGDVYLEVLDNGEAPDERKIAEINQYLSHGYEERLPHIGLKNVHSRVQMMFGEQYGLKFYRDTEQAVTCVSIHLPYRREAE